MKERKKKAKCEKKMKKRKENGASDIWQMYSRQTGEKKVESGVINVLRAFNLLLSKCHTLAEALHYKPLKTY